MANVQMTRLQSYFPKPLLEELKVVARENRTSVAEIIRRATKEFAQRSAQGRQAKNGATLLLQSLKKVGFKGPRNLASRMDNYLYGRNE